MFVAKLPAPMISYTVLFSDSFENGEWNGLWLEDSQDDWYTSTQRAILGSYSAEVVGRAADATLTVANPIDLTPYGSVVLTFDWFLEKTYWDDEYLAVDLYDGSSWAEVARLDWNVDAENVWHQPIVQIPTDHLVENFQFRFRANLQRKTEGANLDNVQLVGTSLAGEPNNAPVAADDADTTLEDNGITVNVLANDSDPDGDTIQVGSVTDGTNGTVVDNGNGTVTYTPDANFHGTDSFTYRAYDGADYSDPATVTITVDPVNDAPVAVNDAATTPQDTPLIIQALTNDTDVDGDILAIDSFTQGANGTVSDNGDGTLTYTPSGVTTGDDSFTYTVSDGKGGTDTATVNVNVTRVNAAPVAVDDTYTTDEDTQLVGAVLGNDTDGDDDPLTAVLVDGPTNGTLSLDPDGSFTYDPDPNFNGSDSFTYKADDGLDLSNVASVNITIDPVNDVPVAVDDSASTDQDVEATINVLANDTDVDADTLTVTGASDGANGTTVVNVDNTITYTPDPGFFGTDSFTYTIDDGNGGTDTGEVTIDVAEAVTETAFYVYDIRFESQRRDRDWRGVRNSQ